MKNLLKWKWTVVCVLLLFAVAVAVADYNVQNKGSYYNNAPTGLRTNSTGSLLTQEVAPAMDANLTFSSIINNTSGLALAGADSSEILDTRRMRLGTLLLKGYVSGTGTVDTTVVLRLGIQIRTHLNGGSDSSSTFAIYQYGTVPANVATAAAADTSQQGHIYAGLPLTAINTTPSAITAWSGEATVLVSAKRNAHGNSIAINGHTYYYPSGIAISLESLFGRAIYSPYTSVRVRLMTAQKGAAGLATATFIYQMHLVGTPL